MKKNNKIGTLFDGELRKRIKNHDLRLCTWNARTLYRYGAFIQLANILEKYNADITAIQEMRLARMLQIGNL